MSMLKEYYTDDAFKPHQEQYKYINTPCRMLCLALPGMVWILAESLSIHANHKVVWFCG